MQLIEKRKKKIWGFVIAFLIFALLAVSGGVSAFTQRATNHTKKDSSTSFVFQNVFQGNAVESVFVHQTNPQEPSFTTTSIDYTLDGVHKSLQIDGFLENAYMVGDSYFSDHLLFVVREIGQYIHTAVEGGS